MTPDECASAVAWATSTDATVRSLLEKIAAAMGTTTTRNTLSIVCLDAAPASDERVRTARAYFAADAVTDADAEPPEVVIVASHVERREDVREVLRHELVHAEDHIVRRRDLRVCEELACSEVKAHASAECASDGGSEMAGSVACRVPPGWWGRDRWCRAAPSRCVSSLAVRATSNVFDRADAEVCVRNVLERCLGEAHATVPVGGGGPNGLGAADVVEPHGVVSTSTSSPSQSTTTTSP